MKLPLPLLLLTLAASADLTANGAPRKRAQPKLLPTADPAKELKPAITIQRASKTFDIPYSTLRQWIREGRLPAYRIANGRQVRVYVEDLEALFVRIGGDDQPTSP